MLHSKDNLRIDRDLPLTSDRIPLDIPDNTEVPRWAYLNVTVCARLDETLVPSPKTETEQEEDNFNITAARVLVGTCPSKCFYRTRFYSLPTENLDMSDRSPSLAMSSDPGDPTPSTTNHIGAIVGGKLFGGLRHTTS